MLDPRTWNRKIEYMFWRKGLIPLQPVEIDQLFGGMEERSFIWGYRSAESVSKAGMSPKRNQTTRYVDGESDNRYNHLRLAHAVLKKG